MEPFRQKGSSMASWSTFIFKSEVQVCLFSMVHLTTAAQYKNNKCFIFIKALFLFFYPVVECAFLLLF